MMIDPRTQTFMNSEKLLKISEFNSKIKISKDYSISLIETDQARLVMMNY